MSVKSNGQHHLLCIVLLSLRWATLNETNIFSMVVHAGMKKHVLQKEIKVHDHDVGHFTIFRNDCNPHSLYEPPEKAFYCLMY